MTATLAPRATRATAKHAPKLTRETRHRDVWGSYPVYTCTACEYVTLDHLETLEHVRQCDADLPA